MKAEAINDGQQPGQLLLDMTSSHAVQPGSQTGKTTASNNAPTQHLDKTLQQYTATDTACWVGENKPQLAAVYVRVCVCVCAQEDGSEARGQRSRLLLQHEHA